LEFKDKIDVLFSEHYSRFGDNATLKEKILEELGEDIMLKASQKRLEQQNKNLKKQVQYLQELSQSKVNFQSALIEEEKKNEVLKQNLNKANRTIEYQKEDLRA
jgi:cell division protein FtsB